MLHACLNLSHTVCHLRCSSGLEMLALMGEALLDLDGSRHTVHRHFWCELCLFSAMLHPLNLRDFSAAAIAFVAFDIKALSSNPQSRERTIDDYLARDDFIIWCLTLSTNIWATLMVAFKAW